MADINGINFNVSGSPDVQHTVAYTKNRLDNSRMQYNFTITSKIVYSGGWIGTGTGYGLNATFTVNGTSASATMKSESTKWSYGTTYTTTVSVICSSTTANATQAVTFAVTSTGTVKAGTMSNSSYTVTSAPLLYTAGTSPTAFTASPSVFEDNITLTWSGASGGTNNSIVSYRIEYIISTTTTDNTTWESSGGNPIWRTLATINSTSTSGSYQTNMSSLVNRGYYVKFRIRTQGSAGSDYYSGWKYMDNANAIRRQPYTTCVAPTIFTITPDDASTDGFNAKLTLSWSGASGGTGNSIQSYLIRYATSSDNSNWTSWSDLQTITSNATSGTISNKDFASMLTRGYYIKFAIQTQGSAGSSYYSGWKYSSTSYKRNPYTKCGEPQTITLTSSKTLEGTTLSNVFESSITVSWSGATAGANNAISKYQLEYRTSADNTSWGNWTTYSSPTTTSASISPNISRGNYIQYRVKTVGAKSGYDSDYKMSNAMRRNSLPSAISSISVTPATLEYSKGDNITISWSKPSDTDNNIYKYRVRLYPNISDMSSYKDYETTALSFDLLPNDANYMAIANNQQLRFAVKPIDVFGAESPSDTQSSIITRYDSNGISIGINGKWVNCQVYYGQNGQWVEQTAYAEIDNTWKECGL